MLSNSLIIAISVDKSTEFRLGKVHGQEQLCVIFLNLFSVAAWRRVSSSVGAFAGFGYVQEHSSPHPCATFFGGLRLVAAVIDRHIADSSAQLFGSSALLIPR